MSYLPPPGDQPPGQDPYGQQPYGQPPYGQQGYPMMPPPPTHGTATTSLILGIISLVACGLLTGIPAMILGRKAKQEIAASNGRLGGDGLATAGFITGLIGTILSVLGGLALVLLFAVGLAVNEGYENSCQEFNSDGQFVDC